MSSNGTLTPQHEGLYVRVRNDDYGLGYSTGRLMEVSRKNCVVKLDGRKDPARVRHANVTLWNAKNAELGLRPKPMPKAKRRNPPLPPKPVMESPALPKPSLETRVNAANDHTDLDGMEPAELFVELVKAKKDIAESADMLAEYQRLHDAMVERAEAVKLRVNAFVND